MRTLYHEFESLEHLLANRLLPGGDQRPIRFVIFGGTGAVGGASVLELCRMILMSSSAGRPLRGEIYATGMGEDEIEKFVRRMSMALDEEELIEELTPLRRYRLGGRIELRFSVFRLAIPEDLSEHVAERMPTDGDEHTLKQIFSDYFEAHPCPFLSFVEGLGGSMFHAAVVAIPLPSVATYTLDSVNRLVKSHGFDRLVTQDIKKGYLKTFIRGLAVIQQKLARHVVMAHTTAVGGMYRVDGGSPEIRLGFAHSALGERLTEKKYFADELTQLFVDHGFDVLVTAAAIGIDSVDFRCPLPAGQDIAHKMRQAARDLEPTPFPLGDLDQGVIHLYRHQEVAVDLDATDSKEADPAILSFGDGRDLKVEAAIRSGENGLFSVANCVALYNVMKVAIPEELAMVLVRHAVFGPERRRDWFQDKVAYYGETENCYFALRLLDSYPELVRAHHGPFALQSYQALGSATHQARLHELGLVMLVLRLRQLADLLPSFSDQELQDGSDDVATFLWRRTAIPSFQDLAALGVEELAIAMSELCRVTGDDPTTWPSLGCGENLGRKGPGHQRFMCRLAERIERYRRTITSLGIPILYRTPEGDDRILVGPYAAPLDMAVCRAEDLRRRFARSASELGVSTECYRDWGFANCGFVDLRPVAIGSSAQVPGEDLSDRVRVMNDRDDLVKWLESLTSGSYFTTSGLVAFHYRVGRLGQKVCGRKVRLGTRETWKHLFRQDRNQRHLISPGLVETVRMYSEGLGKITGTEALWPRWGY